MPFQYASVDQNQKSSKHGQHAYQNARNMPKHPSGDFDTVEIGKKRTVWEIQPPKQKKTRARREKTLNRHFLMNPLAKIQV